MVSTAVRAQAGVLAFMTAVVIILALPGTASAQRFLFEKKKFRGTPGETLDIGVYVANSPKPITGANFTVRLSAEDAGKVLFSEATSEVNPQLGAFAFGYADNYLERQGVQTGTINGNVAEFRGATYSTRNPPFSVPAGSSPRLIATIYVPIHIDASGRVLIELVSAIDDGTALLGVADNTGEPLIPEGNEVAPGDLATIVIEQRGPTVTDFTDPKSFDGWVYQAPLPAAPDPKPQGDSLAGEGLRIRSVIDGSNGTWIWDFVNRGAWMAPRANRLLVTDWEISSDAEGTATPPFRLRQISTNSVLSAETLIQDLTDADEISVVPGTAGRTYRTIVQVPQFASDDYSGDGMVPAFDMVQFDGMGEPGKAITLSRLTDRVLDENSLSGKALKYFQTFDARHDGGWKFSDGDLGGREVSFGRGRHGLGITSGGPLTSEGGEQAYSYGYWYAEPGILQVNVDSSRWYRVDAHVIGTANKPENNPMARLRVYPENSEYYSMLVFAPHLDLNDYFVPRPSVEGTTLTAWFQMPGELDGEPLGIAFDMIHVDGPTDGSDQNPALFLKWIRIQSFEEPPI